MINSARRILLQGTVQGCGVRPALARLAAQRHWSGSVRNVVAGVELVLQGALPADEQLLSIIHKTIPPSAIIDRLTCTPTGPSAASGFEILDSQISGAISTSIPRDRAICDECLQDIRDPTNRRFHYPFTTCAQCGPRYSILLSMPFDRSRTSMRVFPMCDECRREYHDPCDRRYHAQTISCPNCGPTLWTDPSPLQTQSLLNDAADQLRSGRILALRGIGGYQLLVDATSATAVTRLRDRKRRKTKPFAILVPTVAEAQSIANLNAVEYAQLTSAANPIVIARQSRQSGIVTAVNPGLHEIGIMLPTTALHAILLAKVGRPLVCTSGNREGDPLAYQPDEAIDRLGGIADVFLHHDRDIVSPIDDSVVKVMAMRPVTIRAARGIAPMPLHIPSPSPEVSVIACGGHQKGSIAIGNSYQSVLGPHIGDLETVPSQDRWIDHATRTRGLFDVTPDACLIACDAHPTYFSTQWAREERSEPQQIWHHHAHVVCGMIEHGWLDREVLGVAWDGTGLGPDGSIWGGEFLRSTTRQFQRVAHLRPFALPGGDAAIAEPGRVAVAILSQLPEFTTADIASLLRQPEHLVRRIQTTLNSKFSPQTTSCGRMFDAAASLILQISDCDFEGHAAMRLEACCDLTAEGQYHFDVQPGPPLQLDWRPVIRSILQDLQQAKSAGIMAMRFHRALAQLIIDIADRFPETPVVLQGGVFQNRVLVEAVASLWSNDRQALGLPGVIPPNDGGLAAGQLAICLASRAAWEK